MNWRWNELTERQKRIALLAIDGQLNKFGIAREIGISKSTVGFHLSNIYNTLGVKHWRVQLAFLLGQHWKEIQNGEKMNGNGPSCT